MKKDNILFTIIGLLAGLIIGFIATNNYNRQVLVSEFQSQQNKPPLNQQNPGASVPAVAEAIEKADKDPTNFEAQVNAGEMFDRINNFDKAITYFEKAHKIKPDDYQAIVKLGNLNFEIRKFDEVQKWYEMALAKKSDDFMVRADYGLSFFLREPKDIDRAIKEYKLALSINPNYEAVLQNLAVAYSEKKDSVGLKDTISKLEKVNPNNQIIQKLKE